MVLHPFTTAPVLGASERYIPVWSAIEASQLRRDQEYWLVSQPDHAALSGDLAGNIVSPMLPQLTPDAVQAIALHDAGWSILPSEKDPTTPPLLRDDGTPLSFLEIAPADFTRAWIASIDLGEEVSALGGLMVSGHFVRIAKMRLEQKEDAPEDTRLLRAFIDQERIRRERLVPLAHLSTEEVELFTDVLQFCDVLSLYLCCGSTAQVEFPQEFSGRCIRVRRLGDVIRCDPSPFRREGHPDDGISLGVRAGRFPHSDTAANFVALPLLLS